MKGTSCPWAVACFLFACFTVIPTIESREEIINLIDRLVRYLNRESGTHWMAIFK